MVPFEKSVLAGYQGWFAPQNEIPRLAGEFFWAQAYYVSPLGTGAFVAMFDEATAIAKAAENTKDIPTDAYYLTLDADTIPIDWWPSAPPPCSKAPSFTRVSFREQPSRDGAGGLESQPCTQGDRAPW